MNKIFRARKFNYLDGRLLEEEVYVVLAVICFLLGVWRRRRRRGLELGGRVVLGVVRVADVVQLWHDLGARTLSKVIS